MLPLFAAAIISTTISNSSTGGNVVSNGGDVVNGTSYSSVSVQTYDNDSGGTSTVHVVTDENGQMNEQTYTKTIPPGGSADIDISTSTRSNFSGQAGRANVRVDSVIRSSNATSSWRGKEASSTTWQASTTASSSFAAQVAVPGFSLGLRSLLQYIFSWFRFW